METNYRSEVMFASRPKHHLKISEKELWRHGAHVEPNRATTSRELKLTYARGKAFREILRFLCCRTLPLRLPRLFVYTKVTNRSTSGLLFRARRDTRLERNGGANVIIRWATRREHHVSQLCCYLINLLCISGALTPPAWAVMPCGTVPAS